MSKRSTHALASHSDTELLRRTLVGEMDAFESLYERLEGMVYRFALRMCGSAATADDVTQDVFLSLIRNGHLYDPSRGALIKYLLGMTRNRILTLLQRERSFVPLSEEGEEEIVLAHQMIVEADPLLVLEQAERIKAVRQAILSLPVHYREVLSLCSLEELSYEEAASVLGCPIGTVRSRLNRARSMLIEKLAEMATEKRPEHLAAGLRAGV